MIPATRRLAIIAAADAIEPHRWFELWADAAYEALTPDELTALENAYYALPQPSPRFGDVLRRELLGEDAK